MTPYELRKKINDIASSFQLSNIEEHFVSSKNNLASILEKKTCLLLTGENYNSLINLNSELSESIDFCYIDPPYNTGQKFIYSDNRISRSSSLWGNHHDWLAFMLPRLVIARELICETGVIAVSIDDYEYAHLKILLDHIFGAEQYIGTLIICRSKNGKGSKSNIAVNHEYVVLYSKGSKVTFNGLPESDEKIYTKKDEFGEFNIDGLFRKKGDASLRTDRPNMYYPLFYSEDGRVYTEEVDGLNLKIIFPVDSKGIDRRWLWGKDKAKNESWKLYASNSGVIYVKNYRTLNKRIKIRSFLSDLGYLTDRATSELKERFGDKIFETPKPLKLIQDLVDCCAPKNGIILDFFAGTGTTAEAVWAINKMDQGQRKIILAESNLLVPPDHIAASNGYKKISDITKRRLEIIMEKDSNFSFCEISFETSDPEQLSLL